MNTFQEIPVNTHSLSIRRPIYGIAINDAPYLIEYKVDGKRIPCPYYQTWKSMLERCYSPKKHEKFPTYIGCTVCEEWLTFSNFRSWMEKQHWKNRQLDKDILIKGNKVYSPDTCVFVTKFINTLLLTSLKTRGKYLLGVSWHKHNKKYGASCCGVNLGYFSLESDAHEAYCLHKAELLLTLANLQEDVRIKNALIERANTIHLEK